MGSIGNLNAKITADANQFVNEFARADNAARRSATAIDAEISKLSKSISKKFSFSDVGKDLLKGFGIGGGFAAAQHAAEKIAGLWREAAESAKSIEESTAKALEATLKGIRLRQSPQQQLDALEKERARVGRELATAKNATIQADPQNTFQAIGAFAGAVSHPNQWNEANDKVHRLAAEYANLGSQIDELSKKLKDESSTQGNKDAESDAQRRARGFSEQLKQQEDAFDELIRKQHEANETSAKARKEAEELAQKYREIADPTLKYKEQIAEVNKLWSDGKLKANEAADAIRNITSAMNEDEARRVDEAVKKEFEFLFDAMDSAHKKQKKQSEETERIVGLAADGMANAWVDALNGVEGAWGNLGSTVLREIEKIVAEILIVKPIINGLGGIISGFGGGVFGAVGAALSGYGGGKASGGPVEAGVTYRVNEEGQEFFRPNVGGTIVPAGLSRAMSTGKRGDTYFIDATGADATKISQLESIIRSIGGSVERRAVAAVIAAKRAGGGNAAALA